MTGIPAMLMRGGTSKGVFFLADDLPAAAADRDDLLLRILGSPDPGQRDGLGGNHPLTSKVAVLSPSADPGTDVDYLFVQVQVDAAIVTTTQTCGNILAGVGPFAIERGLVAATDPVTTVAVRMVNTGGVARATVHTPGRQVTYDGDTPTSGLTTTAADVLLEFAGTEGATCGRLLPTGRARDTIDGIDVTCIDNGMPTVVLNAADLDVTGSETPEALEANTALRQRLERVRVTAGHMMNLGDVTTATTPKMTLAAPPRNGGTMTTRTFIPHRCHTSIGVLGAVSVGTAALIDGSVAADLALLDGNSRIRLEHPTGFFDVECEIGQVDGEVHARRSAVVRTARKLFDGVTWPGPARPAQDGTRQ